MIDPLRPYWPTNRSIAGLLVRSVCLLAAGSAVVERLEAGESAQLSSLIRLCRALELLGNLDAIIPEIAPSPIAQLKLRGKDRKRASSKVASKTPGRSKKWQWGTDQ